MSTFRFALVPLLALVLAAPAVADDSGHFIVRLGQDTVSVESYRRNGPRIEVDQVGRTPRVLQRHYTYDYTGGPLKTFTLVVTPPGSQAPTQTIEAANGPDSLRMKIRNGTAPPIPITVALPANALMITSSSPWALYEMRIMEMLKAKRDSLRCPLYFAGATSMNSLLLRRIGKDSVLVSNDHEDVYHAKIDREGRVLGVLPIAGTQQMSVERVSALDMNALAASFAAREKSGAAVAGPLSPRDSVKVTTAGASLYVDYGRPSKRGRVIFGSNIVPYGQVWRTGANAATQLRTDKALKFGSVTVPAGFYTLWTVPGPTSWKLLVNSETGEWGTQHNPEKDLYTIDMGVSALTPPVERFTIRIDPTAGGGTLNLDWDTTRASASFVVQP